MTLVIHVENSASDLVLGYWLRFVQILNAYIWLLDTALAHVCCDLLVKL